MLRFGFREADAGKVVLSHLADGEREFVVAIAWMRLTEWTGCWQKFILSMPFAIAKVVQVNLLCWRNLDAADAVTWIKGISPDAPIFSSLGDAPSWFKFWA